MFTVSARLIVVVAAFIYSGYLLNQGDEIGWCGLPLAAFRSSDICGTAPSVPHGER